MNLFVAEIQIFMLSFLVFYGRVFGKSKISCSRKTSITDTSPQRWCFFFPGKSLWGTHTLDSEKTVFFSGFRKKKKNTQKILRILGGQNFVNNRNFPPYRTYQVKLTPAPWISAAGEILMTKKTVFRGFSKDFWKHHVKLPPD